MAKIFFHSPSVHCAACLLGPERAHLHFLLARVGEVVTGIPQFPSASPAAINSCLGLRSDILTLAARIHGQCENHGWIAGPDRAWIASIISQGLSLGAFRQNMGWEELQTFLRSNQSEPVVMSYSVTESFPNQYFAECSSESWDNLSEAEQWEIAMGVLSKEAAREISEEDAPFSRQLSPRNWDSYFFAD